MKIKLTQVKTTNYHNTFIEVAEDCPVKFGEMPMQKGGARTAAVLQYEMIISNPYRYSSDDVLFGVFAIKNNIDKTDFASEREKFFSKGQPCFRSSPLTKRYGWGVHSDADGKIALYAMDSSEYKKWATDKRYVHLKAMRSKRK